jgi:hypothetical protein
LRFFFVQKIDRIAYAPIILHEERMDYGMNDELGHPVKLGFFDGHDAIACAREQWISNRML